MPKYTKENRSWVITSATRKEESVFCERRKELLYITSWMQVNIAMLSTKTETILRNVTRSIVWQAWNLSATLQERWLVQESLDENKKHWCSHFLFSPTPISVVSISQLWVQLDPLTGMVESKLVFCWFDDSLFPTWLTALAQGACWEWRGGRAAQPAPCAVV